MWHKVVQRLPATSSEGDDLLDMPGLIDFIELELDLSTGSKSLRNRLLDLADSLASPSEDASKKAIVIILEAAKRLEKIEGHLLASGFETARDTSEG